MTNKFNIGDKVWRVQGKFDDMEGIIAHGPATVRAIVYHYDTINYLLTWSRGREITDEQKEGCLYSSQIEAQIEADRQHNNHCENLKRSLTNG